MARPKIIGDIIEIKDRVNEQDIQIDELDVEIHEPNYTPIMKRQEPVFSVGTGYVDGILTDLKTDIIKGQVPINAKGLSVINLVKNGSFTNILLWTVYNSTLTVNNNIGTLSATSQYGQILQPVNSIIGNKYYFTAIIKSTSNQARIGMGTTYKYHSGSNVYEKLSIVHIATITKHEYSILDYRTSGWDNIYIKNALGVNLTSKYGVGNEPTLEQCDKIFANWFDGIGSVNNVRVKSIGKNLVEKTLATSLNDYVNSIEIENLSLSNKFVPIVYSGGYSQTVEYIGIDKVKCIATSTDRVFYARVYVKPNTTYTISTFNGSGWIKLTSTSNNLGIVNFHLATISNTTLLLSDFQLEEGTVATAYEPYIESISPLPKMNSLPNGVKDEIVNGKFIKRIQEYILQASDSDTFNNTTYINFDILQTKASIFTLARMDSWLTATYAGNVLVNGFDEVSFSDIASNANKIYTSTGKYIAFLLPKGTYTNLAAAQTALAGTKILYELATPIVSDLVTPLTVYPNGTISIESDSETTIPELNFSYPLNISSLVSRLNDSINQNNKLIESNKKQIKDLNINKADVLYKDYGWKTENEPPSSYPVRVPTMFRASTLFGGLASSVQVFTIFNSDGGVGIQLIFRSSGELVKFRLKNGGLDTWGPWQEIATVETGTWTPTIIGETTQPSISYTYQRGTFVKIGKLIKCSFFLRATLTGGAGNISIGGFPAIIKNIDESGIVNLSSLQNVSLNYKGMSSYGSNLNYMRVIKDGRNIAQISEINNDTIFDINGSITYETP